jgi:PAS domain S-box-containing protein
MKIRTRLIILAVTPVLFLLLLSLYQYRITASFLDSNAKAVLADGVVKSFAQLAVLTLEHHIYYEERAHQQWQMKYDVIGRQLDEVSGIYTSPDERKILTEIRQRYKTIGMLFESYGLHHAAKGAPMARSTDWQKFADRLTSRLLEELEQATPQLEKLHETNHTAAMQYERRHGYFVIIMLSVMAMVIPLFAIFVYRSVAGPLQKLHEAISTISAGDLNSRTGILADNEIGEVAAAFDRMAAQRWEADQRIKLINEELEGRVAERTMELTVANRNLTAEIAERRQVEEARKNLEIQYRLLFDNAGDGIMILDLQGHILKLNRIFCERLGYREEELLGKTPAQLDPPEYVPLVEERVALLRAEGRALFETAHCRKDGTIMPVEINCRRVEYDGSPALMSIVRDISERKRIEDELRKLKESAEAANRAKSEFLANMSHEIRTPLNGITGLSQLLLDTELNPKQRDYLVKLHSSSQVLFGIINDILDFSKIEAGKLELESVEFSLADILATLTDLAGAWAEAKHLGMRCEMAPGIPETVIGDPFRITQVLTNLLNNAIKFTEQGEIVVATGLVDDREDAATVTLRFTVRDSGIGMTPQQLSQLFQPFTQADSSTTRKYGGTGLGLSICKRLVELMGGTIAVQSVPGEGSAFSFVITLQRGVTGVPDRERVVANSAPGVARGYAPMPDVEALKRVSGMRVLVAEDNAVNQVFIRDALANAGVLVDIAENGRDAVAAVRQNSYDVVFMDIQMPVMDGFEATRLIREMAGKDLPVIAMTAHAFAEDREKSRAAGMNTHLVKPISMAALLHTLHQYAPDEPGTGQSNRIGVASGKVTGDPGHGVPVLPGIDLAAALETLDGDMSLLWKLLQTFAADKADIVTEVESARERGDLKTIERKVHGVKGVAGYLGATGLQQVAADIEDACEQGDVSTVTTLMPIFAARVGEVIASAGLADEPA